MDVQTGHDNVEGDYEEGQYESLPGEEACMMDDEGQQSWFPIALEAWVEA